MHEAPHLPDGLTLHTARHITELSVETMYRIGQLREEVFVVEQNCVCLDFDGRDLEPETRQVWIENSDGTIAATLRILDESGRQHTGIARNDLTSIGRVVTAPAFRGQGLAAVLMHAAITECGRRPIILFAQSHLTHWYARFGFEPYGDEFIEDGIPHTPMLRVSSAAGQAPERHAQDHAVQHGR